MSLLGPGRTPLALTNLRKETLADMNRGRLRGWIALGVGALIVFAIVAWPNLILVLVFVLAAATLGLFFARVTLATLSDAERTRADDGELPTGELD